MIRKFLIYIFVVLSIGHIKTLNAQILSPWVPDQTLGVHYLTSINGNFARSLNYQGESVQALLSLSTNGEVSFILSRDIPNIKKEYKGRLEIKNGNININLDEGITIQSQIISRTYRQSGVATPRMLLNLYLQSSSIPQFLQGDYRQLGGSLSFDSNRLTKVSVDKYANPPTIIPATTKDNAQGLTTNFLEKHSQILNIEIERLKVGLALAKEAQIANEKSEKSSISEEATRKKTEKRESEGPDRIERLLDKLEAAQKTEFNKNPTANMQTGVRYVYTLSSQNPVCNNEVTWKCLTASQYKDLCKSAKSITSGSIQGLKHLKLSPYDVDFFQAASLRINIEWIEASIFCSVNIEASGIYRGTSKKMDVAGEGIGFVLASNGSILIGIIR